MTSVPPPEPGELLLSDGSAVAAAVSEVVAVGVVFIVLAHVAVGVFDIEAMMPSFLTGPERAVGATFMVGAAVQMSLVLILSLLFTDLRQAVGNSVKFGTIPGWSVAVMAASIHAATIAVFFLDEPGRIFEQSSRNALLSLAPAVDGWSQEVLFRGYVIYRLARGGLPVAVQIGVSALLFAAIHVGYIGSDFWTIFWPMFGTAVLGGFFAWSVLLARGALLPVVLCHAVLVAIVQPWLALS
jgi:hypothetical protein